MPTHRAYISGIGQDFIEISGPPSTIRGLTCQTTFADHCTASQTIHGLFHAAHLHSSLDIHNIFHFDDLILVQGLQEYHLVAPTISTSCTWLPGEPAAVVLKAAIAQYLNEPTVIATLISRCQNTIPPQSILTRDHAVILHSQDFVARELVRNLTTTSSAATEPIDILDIAPTKPNTVASGNSKLAIVGMSGRFPEADDVDQLWQLLVDGREVHGLIPNDRFSIEKHVDPKGKAINSTYTPYGCWIKDPGLFDHKFFNMSRREALQTDPQQRLALVTAYEALEMSGYVPNRTPSTNPARIGTFYGQTSDDWREINAAQDIDTYYITGGIRAFGPGRISYYFGFKGPSLNIDTACASSAASIQVACTSLLAGECDTAVVGGLSILTNPDLYSGLSRGQFLSKKGPCATFDDAADGYCRADACASIVVKRIEDAISDHDHILGVILSTVTNHSAGAVSITHPHAPSQSELYTSILDQARVDPFDVDFVEMHGTGTQAGDGTEMESVLSVFAPADHKRPYSRPLYLGACKASIGHGEAASGITSVIKALKMFERRVIPPHIGIKPDSIINKTFPKDLNQRNVYISNQRVPFNREDGNPLKIFVSNFSAAGGNTGILLEEAPRPVAPLDDDPRDTHIITITAKSKSALLRNAERMATWISCHPETPLSHIAYTTTARRIHHGWRIAVAATTLQQAEAAIEKCVVSDDISAPITSASALPSICFVFTGQGSFYYGMGRVLYTHYSRFRKAISEFDRLARIHTFPTFESLISGNGPELENLDDPSPVAIQLAIVCFEMAVADLWSSWGVKPEAVLGHSLGEYAAMYTCGILSASDTIYLVGHRAQLVARNCTVNTHAMLAVLSPASPIKPYIANLAPQVEITCINSPNEMVIGGPISEIAKATQQLNAVGFRCTELKVPFAFHTSQMDPVLDELEQLASGMTFAPPMITFISSLYGRKLLPHEGIDAAYIRRQAREYVRFVDGIHAMQDLTTPDSNTIYIETGPHAICSNMIRTTCSTSRCVAALPTVRRNESTHAVLCNTLKMLYCSGVAIRWDELHSDFSKSVLLLVDLPLYSFDKHNHWIQYQGDWTLTRKEKACTVAKEAVQKQQILTSSVHQVVKETVMGKSIMIETETNLARHDLYRVIIGHKCNGVPLVPSTVYADIAITVAAYAVRTVEPAKDQSGLNVSHLKIQKALLFDTKLVTQILHCTAHADASLGYVSVLFYTRQGTLRHDHAQCRVYTEDLAGWKAEFERTNYLIASRLAALNTEKKDSNLILRMDKKTIYSRFSNFVDYSLLYQGLNEVVFNSTTWEAMAELSFQPTEESDFIINPVWLDNCLHLSGFVLNQADLNDVVFIAEGWESLKLLGPLQLGTVYQSYTRMEPVTGGPFMEGDIYVLQNSHIIGVARGIRFRQIPRKALDLLLPHPKGQTVEHSTPMLNEVPQRSNNNVSNTVQQTKLEGGPREVSSLWDTFLETMQSELGCEPGDLIDYATFSSLGCDSLMILVISVRLREEFGVHIGLHAFLEHPTIAEFKEYLHRAVLSENKCDDADVNSIAYITGLEGATTGRDSYSLFESMSDDQCSSKLPNKSNCSPPASEGNGEGSSTGLQEDGRDDEDSSSFSFTSSSTSSSEVHAPAIRQKLCLEPPSSPVSSFIDPTESQPELDNSQMHFTARSVLLRGDCRIATKNLFMIPDGSGSAYSYAEIGDLGKDWAIWGLISPFVKAPTYFTCGIHGIAQKYVDSIRQHQQHGPYTLAGWSVGGTIAYEMVDNLTRTGENVSHLILIDSPPPFVQDPLPKTLIRWFADVGLIGRTRATTGGGGKSVPDWLVRHFDATVAAFTEYKPISILADKCPKTVIIWCEDGVCKTKQDPRPDPYPTGHSLFLLENRHDFGPRGWDELLSREKIDLAHIPGNHFTMMHGQLVS